jgi:hypothetical protein
MFCLLVSIERGSEVKAMNGREGGNVRQSQSIPVEKDRCVSFSRSNEKQIGRGCILIELETQYVW